MATVTKIEYSGLIWCPTVSTGAFVARRNGKVFITGNSGFPKSLDVSKAIDKAAGAEREFTPVGNAVKRMIPGADQNATGSWIKDNGREYQPGVSEPATEAARQWSGWGTSLKPSLEPVTVARKPLSEGTVAANVLAHGTGALNIDGCRVEPTGESRERVGEASQDRRYTDAGGTNFAAKPGVRGGDPAGRWPANLIHDGSEEVLTGFPSSASPWIGNPNKGAKGGRMFGGSAQNTEDKPEYRDAGSAARFFYCAKASKRDRGEGNTHPTVKPTDLMRYLCRLVTPPGGVVLDPFMGSGSTGKAAMHEGFRFIGIERESSYLQIAQARIEHALLSHLGII